MTRLLRAHKDTNKGRLKRIQEAVLKLVFNKK
jgi:hypothetical protein